MRLVAARVLARDRERVERVAVVVRNLLTCSATGAARLEHAEAERGESAALRDASVLRARDDVVPRRRETWAALQAGGESITWHATVFAAPVVVTKR